MRAEHDSCNSQEESLATATSATTHKQLAMAIEMNQQLVRELTSTTTDNDGTTGAGSALVVGVEIGEEMDAFNAMLQLESKSRPLKVMASNTFSGSNTSALLSPGAGYGDSNRKRRKSAQVCKSWLGSLSLLHLTLPDNVYYILSTLLFSICFQALYLSRQQQSVQWEVTEETVQKKQKERQAMADKIASAKQEQEQEPMQLLCADQQRTGIGRIHVGMLGTAPHYLRAAAATPLWSPSAPATQNLPASPCNQVYGGPKLQPLFAATATATTSSTRHDFNVRAPLSWTTFKHNYDKSTTGVGLKC